MTAAEELIAEHLRNRQKRISETVAGHERWAVIELVRALDHIAFAISLAPNRGEIVRYDHARRYMLLGAAAALRPLLEHLRDTDGPVRWQATEDTASGWADTALHGCGLLVHLARMAALERYGLARTSMPASDRLVIEVADDSAEATDRHALGWLRSSQRDALAANGQRLASLAMHFRDRIDEYTGVDNGWFIRYDSDPELRNYYREVAANRSAGIVEGSALPDDTVISSCHSGIDIVRLTKSYMKFTKNSERGRCSNGRSVSIPEPAAVNRTVA